MSDWDYSDMGDKIQSIVEDAVNSMNFAQLDKNIRGSIKSVFDELDIEVPDSVQKSLPKKAPNKVRYHYGSDRRERADGRNRDGQPRGDGREQTRALAKYAKNPPGSLSGTLCTVLGAIFTFLFGLSFFVVAGTSAVIPDMLMGGTIALVSIFPFLVASVVVLAKGISLRGRVRRYRTYVRTIGHRSYCQLSELASATGKSVKYVAKDVQRMIENKSFLHGHLDAQRTCLMLDDQTYRQYLETQDRYHQRMLDEKKQQQSDREVFSSSGIDNPDLVKAIEEGNSYIMQIRQANDAIPGEEISAKLFRLEALIKKIFEVLRKKPDQLPKLRKFMNYYMPTTLKLVKTYQELDAQPVAGENIRNSKMEIEKTLDTINLAYEKLLDSFFEDAAMDISTDISVLETMFAQEGLTKRQFENIN